MALAGILLNMYVVLRLYKFARLEPNRFEHGCGLPLLVMAITDVLTLVGVVVFDFLGFVIVDEYLYHNAILQNIFCK
uniref:G-protein coupled receptors family 1 profile domain-containing protein n=1 Tax=Plectus sambesii TaxID=2011161 RepID=A0A914V2X6_9BILA